MLPLDPPHPPPFWPTLTSAALAILSDPASAVTYEVSLEAPSNAVVSKCYNAMMKASTAGHTGPSTPWGLCVMEMGRGALEWRLTRPIFNWSAVPGGWGFTRGAVKHGGVKALQRHD